MSAAAAAAAAAVKATAMTLVFLGRFTSAAAAALLTLAKATAITLVFLGVGLLLVHLLRRVAVAQWVRFQHKQDPTSAKCAPMTRASETRVARAAPTSKDLNENGRRRRCRRGLRQPSRFSVRGGSDWVETWCAVATMAERLRPLVWMTADLHDAYFFTKEFGNTLERPPVDGFETRVRQEYQKLCSGQILQVCSHVILGDCGVQVADEKMAATAVNSAAVELVRKADADPTRPWCALRIKIPSHIAVALWVRDTNLVELFDSSGYHNLVTRLQIRLVKEIFMRAGLEPPNVVITNMTDLQSKHDSLCFYYTYHFIRRRTKDRIIAPQIVQELVDMKPEDRFYKMYCLRSDLLHS
jgi:hypothetical protein